MYVVHLNKLYKIWPFTPKEEEASHWQQKPQAMTGPSSATPFFYWLFCCCLMDFYVCICVEAFAIPQSFLNFNLEN